MADFLPEDAADAGAVAEGQDTGLHGHAEGHRGLDGVEADIVHQLVGLGDVVEIVDTAVGAHGPDRLVLKAGGQILACLGVVIDLRTLDDAAGMAVVLRLAAAGDDGVVHGLAGDLLVAVELAEGEVPGRQAAGLVDDIDQDVGAVLAERLADRVVDQGLGKGPVGLLEFCRVGDRHLARPWARWR